VEGVFHSGGDNASRQKGHSQQSNNQSKKESRKGKDGCCQRIAAFTRHRRKHGCGECQPKPGHGHKEPVPCLAINAGEFNYSRPTVRLFYTQGFWNDGAKAAFASGAGGNRIAQVYGDVNTGGSLGLQAEAWW